MEIIVLKSDIIEEMVKTTTYTGEKTETADRSAFRDRVTAGGNDTDLLTRYWRDACAHIVESLRNFVTSVSFGQETLRLTLETGTSFDETLIPAIENGIFAHIAAAMTARWFGVTFPDRSEEWRLKSIRHYKCVIANLYHHKPPIRK